MKKLYFLLFALTFGLFTQAQTTVFEESFEMGNSGTTSVDCNDGSGDFFARTDGSDISGAYVVNGADGTFFFAAQDIDATECGASDIETLTFTGIDISTYTDMTLAVLVAEDDASDGNQDWDDNTSVVFEINIDGGGYQNILQFSGGGATNTEPGLDTDNDGTADSTLLTNIFQEFTASLGGTGTTADLRISFNNLDAGDEDIAIDNIRIIDGFTASPEISITAPSNANEFAPGTSSVDVEFNTANLGGTETVNILVNGVLTMDVTSPFTVPTMDGQTYNVTVELIDGGVLDSDAVSFSVGSLVTVTDIAALRADVTTNGLGRFYEITGASLVTHTDGFRNRKWIQDTNVSGVLIYDEAGTITTTYNVGDLVSGLRGTTTESNGILRFIPTSDAGTIDSSGNMVTPQIVSIADLNAAPDDYESELVELTNVTFVAGDGVATFGTGTNYDLTDGTNTIIKRTDFFSADYIGSLIPVGQLPSVVAVSGEFNGTTQIYVRDLNDLTLSSNEFDINAFSIYPNPSSTGVITISSPNNDEMNVRIFDILGKEVKNEVLTNNTLDVSSLRTGMYLVKITQNNASTTKKLVIR